MAEQWPGGAQRHATGVEQRGQLPVPEPGGRIRRT